jgi:hypothetical protein
VFLGHYGVALAAKRAAPENSMGVLVLAAQWLDGIWPIFLLLGWERVAIVPGITRMVPLDFESYPWSHSLLMTAVWSALIGGVVTWRVGFRAGTVAGLCVTSHWFLDVLMHRPDLPLYPGGTTRLGLGLWNSAAATWILEALFFLGGVWLYLRTTTAADRVGRWSFWAFVAFLAVIEVANFTGPPPPSVTAIAWVTLSLWLTIPWAAWFDRHRRIRLGTG